VLVGQPAGSTLLRLHHNFALGEDPVLSAPANVSLTALFPAYKVRCAAWLRQLRGCSSLSVRLVCGMQVSNVVEMSLTNNQKASELKTARAVRIQEADGTISEVCPLC
jgi:hypothetical protein